jgi:hypothetical protein
LDPAAAAYRAPGADPHQGRLGGPVDHGHPHAAGGEFDRRAQAVRAGADDKYLGAGERRGGREATA